MNDDELLVHICKDDGDDSNLFQYSLFVSCFVIHAVMSCWTRGRILRVDDIFIYGGIHLFKFGDTIQCQTVRPIDFHPLYTSSSIRYHKYPTLNPYNFAISLPKIVFMIQAIMIATLVLQVRAHMMLLPLQASQAFPPVQSPSAELLPDATPS